MGRSRRKPSNNKNVGKVAVVDQDEKLVDLLEQVLVYSGIWSTDEGNDSNIWASLSSSLGILTLELEQTANDSSSRTTKQGDDEQLLLDPFLDMEETIQRVLVQIDVLLSEEHQDLTKELVLCNELDTLFQSSTTRLARLRPLAGSLREAFKRRRCLVQEATKAINNHISRIYESAESYEDTVKELRHLSRLIRRRCLDPNEYPLRDVVQVMELLGMENHDDFDQMDVSMDSTKSTDEKKWSQYAITTDLSTLTSAEHNLPPSILDALQGLLGHGSGSVSTILLVGPEGSGKTHHCNTIAQLVQGHVKVIRPSLPYDILGLTVGSAENKLISMVNYAKMAHKKSILILDDIENLVGMDYEGPSSKGGGGSGNRTSSTNNGEPHLISRLRNLLFSLLDKLRQQSNDDSGSGGGQMLLLCTSKTNLGKFTDRFDITCNLGLPSPQQRHHILVEHAMSWIAATGVSKYYTEDPIANDMLMNLTECTSGCSFAELAQYCRQAIATNLLGSSMVDAKNNPLRLFCQAMKQQLQTSMPESLRSGMNADFVDMTVWTARDLASLSDPSSSSKEANATFPLFGTSALRAWEELRRSIVMPVCQAKALSQLLFDGNSSSSSVGGGQVLAGGVLLTGPPGSGKSALAYHCATVASAINPSVKLIDVSCTSLIRKEVGSSERAIHRLFKVAKAAAPCIVLMDGIENVATVRGNDNTTEGTMDRVLSTLLTSLDGIDTSSSSTTTSSLAEELGTMAIIGVTHNVNWIDPALRRPGRLDRILELGLPEKEARQQIMMKHLKETEFESTDIEFPTLESIASHVAENTEGSTGAEIFALCDGAKMLASKDWFEGTQTTSPALRPDHVLEATNLRSC